MTDYLAELAASSVNFGFLSRVEPRLAGDGASAERYVFDDPDAAISRTRRFSETLAKRLVQQAGLSQDSKQFQRVHRLRDASVIPAAVFDAFDRIRVLGNQTTHDYLSDNALALEAVRCCFDVAVWWHRRETGVVSALAFTPPSPTGSGLEEIRAAVARIDAWTRSAVQASAAAPRLTVLSDVVAAGRWQGGTVLDCQGTRLMLRDPVVETHAADRSWTLLHAGGQQLDASASPVWVRGLRTAVKTLAGDEMSAGLRRQGDILAAAPRSSRLPRLVRRGVVDGVQVVVSTRPAGDPWQAVFGPGHGPLDRALVGMATGVLADVAASLRPLHRDGFGHLSLDGDTVLVASAGRRGVLRDVGAAGLPVSAETTPVYRAAEQSAAGRGRPGPATDVFQLAALLRHTCTGFVPTPGIGLPIGAVVPAFPAEVDAVLDAALDSDPARRPAVSDLAVALRAADVHLEAVARA